MTDRREAIMARLEDIAAGVATIRNVYRNVKQVPDDKLPACVIMEGDEAADDNDPVNRPTTSPRRVHMTPQVVIVSGAPVTEIGTDINTIRAAMIKAVLTDATLLALTLDDQGVRYLGLESDLAMGRSMFGQMALNFSISYVLNPSDL